MPLRLSFVWVVLMMVAAPAAAQDDRRVGLVFAYPGAVGVQWDVSGRFGVRVDGTYDRYDSTFVIDHSRILPPPGSPVPPREESSRQHYASIGVSPMITISSANALKIYVAPRLGVSIHHGPGASISLSPVVTGSTVVVVDAEAIVPGTSRIERESETDYLLDAAVAAGAAYRFSDRFAIFGEAGIRYDRVTQIRLSSESSNTAIGLRAGIGGILYF